MSFYTYILYSEKTDKYYIGSIHDIDKRIEKQNAGTTPSTKPGRPWKVVYREGFNTKTDAIKRGIYLKRMKSRIYIESLIIKVKLRTQLFRVSRSDSKVRPNYSKLSHLYIYKVQQN